MTDGIAIHIFRGKFELESKLRHAIQAHYDSFELQSQSTVDSNAEHEQLQSDDFDATTATRPTPTSGRPTGRRRWRLRHRNSTATAATAPPRRGRGCRAASTAIVTPGVGNRGLGVDAALAGQEVLHEAAFEFLESVLCFLFLLI